MDDRNDPPLSADEIRDDDLKSAAYRDLAFTAEAKLDMQVKIAELRRDALAAQQDRDYWAKIAMASNGGAQTKAIVKELFSLRREASRSQKMLDTANRGWDWQRAQNDFLALENKRLKERLRDTLDMYNEEVKMRDKASAGGEG